MKRFRICLLGVALLMLAGGVVRANQSALPFKGGGTNSIIGGGGGGLTASGTGNATHLGNYTRDETLTFTSPVAFTGTVHFVAANGDELHCTTAGQFVSASDAVGTYTIIGGTGRFATASGTAQFTASMTSSSTFDVTFDGGISW